jgi:hypothetical protein
VWSDILPFILNQFFLAISKKKKSFFINTKDISRSHPTIVESFFSRFRIIHVTTASKKFSTTIEEFDHNVSSPENSRATD